MNGRIYDPVLARFMRADPNITNPWHSQDYNRYSYVNNSPLSATDPTGYDTYTGDWWGTTVMMNRFVVTSHWWDNIGPSTGTYFHQGGGGASYFGISNQNPNANNSPFGTAQKGVSYFDPGGSISSGANNPETPEQALIGFGLSSPPRVIYKADAAEIAQLTKQAAVIIRRMNETLSDENTIEASIRLGELVSTAHMVLDEGISLGTTAAKGLSVLKSIATLGGYLVRGSGTLGVGGKVVSGVPGTAAGDIINASIRDQQVRVVGGAVGSEAASTVVGTIFVNEVSRLSYEVQDAFGSGRGAVNAAYSTGAALDRSYFQDAAKLRAIKEEIGKLGPPGGG